MATTRPLGAHFIAPRTDPAAVAPPSSISPPLTGSARASLAAAESVSPGSTAGVRRAVSSVLANIGNSIQDSLRPRKLFSKVPKKQRQMDQGAIAGTVVGVVLAVALIIFCVYPFIARKIRRRRIARLQQADAEAGIQPTGPVDGSAEPHGRVSSNDSFKENGHAVPQPEAGQNNRELSWDDTNDPTLTLKPTTTWHTPDYGSPDTTTHRVIGSRSNTFRGDELPSEGQEQSPNPLFYPFDDEYYPAPADNVHPTELQGTSADYYSASIPSSAFGMFAQPVEEVVQDKRSNSRRSSLRYNVRQMLRRKSGRDRTMSTDGTGSYDTTTAGDPNLKDATPLQRIITNEDPTASPVEASPTDGVSPSFREQDANVPAQSALDAVTETKTPPRSPPVNRTFVASPSPPSHPAPGTVNPMQIMPASTQSERYYQTEQELFVSTHEPSVSPEPVIPEMQVPQIQYASIITSPSPSPGPSMQPTHNTQPSVSSHLQLPEVHEPLGNDDVVMHDAPSQSHLSPMPSVEHGRRPSYTSERSTPLPGPASTVPSSQNTPSTQLDTPSPDSGGSSDFRNSASPQMGLAVPSSTGGYRCDEPGCTQVFDQPHKLKHHQRYHSKEHKCTYPKCGKGFGTKTHLQRHINDRHEKKKKFHCSIQGCDYSRAGGKAFPRKDNWKRHMTKIHKLEHHELPEPVEIDQEMTGT